ncbi:MAG TPA: hypothetical protein VFN73_13365 [Propionibacteriaceae bacterium]|nr:hypothetical protein [Propionibacteriaceae bacterium]
MPRYRFTTSGADTTDETDFAGDDDAQAHARDRSRTEGVVVTVHRHSGHVDAWEYVGEADERE